MRWIEGGTGSKRGTVYCQRRRTDISNTKGKGRDIVMKTLDQAIKALEYCTGFDFVRCQDCPGYSEPDCGVQNDALHYLKEYREMLNTRIYIPEGYTREKTGFTHQDFANTFREEPHFIRDFMVGTSQNLENTSQFSCPKCHSEFVILPESNDALTWEQLKQMTGKPVWLESHGDITEFTGWVIVSNVLEDRSHFILSHYDGDFLTYEMALPDCTFGKEWNVYRKEQQWKR